jgi:hypothetical protein
MAYIECPSCGKSALRVASRCPHCGLIFTPGMIPPEAPNRARRLWVIAGALVAVVAAVVVGRYRTEAPPSPPRAAPAATAPAESRPEPPVAVTAPPIIVQPVAPARDSAVDSTPPAPAAPPRAAPPQAAPSNVAPASTVPSGDQLQRYAMTWVNVRDRRSPNAAPVRVLDPGEAVLVDSLIGGWYRVVIDGQPIGYAYGSNLGETAP